MNENTPFLNVKPTENPLTGLINQLKKLPGIGPKSAGRIAFHLLTLPLPEIKEFSKIMINTRENIKYCKKCFNISLNELCHICQAHDRDTKKICVVAQPKDIFAIEKTGSYKGVYQVLGGLISPIDGIHPELLRISELQERIKSEQIEEIILAINPTVEGDATVLYLTSTLNPKPKTISRLAYGLPMGSEMEYADEITLQKALIARTPIKGNDTSPDGK